jgi:hypothetical protein
VAKTDKKQEGLKRLLQVVKNTRILVGEVSVKGHMAPAVAESLQWLSGMEAGLEKQLGVVKEESNAEVKS